MDAHQQQVVGAALAAHEGVAGALLPILHQIQARLGFVPSTCVPSIARALNLSTAQVHGVLSFYHFFRTEPLASKHQVQLCVAEACQARGALQLKTQCDALAQSLAEHELSVEPVYCLGQCATGPAALLDGRLKARLTIEQVQACLDVLDVLDVEASS